MACLRYTGLGTGVDLRWIRSHPHLPLPQLNRRGIFRKHLQITSLRISNGRHRWQSPLRCPGLHPGSQEDLYRTPSLMQITLGIYFIGVLLSGIRTNSFLFVLARFLTGLSVGGEFTAIFTAVD